MKYRLFIFFVWVSCFSIVSSIHQYQEFGHQYQQHPDGPTYPNYAHKTPVYPKYSQFLNHDVPSHVSYPSNTEPRYGSHHRPETFDEIDPRVPENIEVSPVQNQANSMYEGHKSLGYIPQPHQLLPRPYTVDKTFEIDVSSAEHGYRPDYKHHVAKPWVSGTYPEPYHQQVVYSKPQFNVYQKPPPNQQAHPQHTQPPQQAQPQQPQLPQHLPPPQYPMPHQQPPHQQIDYQTQPSYAVPVVHAQAKSYATSESNVADILASNLEVKDYLESALLKELDDLGNSHHVKSSDVKLEDNDSDMERNHNNNQINKHIKKQLLDNNDNKNKKAQENSIGNPQTFPEEAKHETVRPKKDDNEYFNHPRFAYLNHKEKPTEVKTFPIEIKPVRPHHYRNPIVNHHPYANNPNNNLVNEQQKPAVPSTSLDNMDDVSPIEPQHSKIYENSKLKDKEVTVNDHDLHTHEQHSKRQSEPKPPQPHIIHPENDYIPTNKHSKIPSHSTPTDQIIIENPVNQSVDTPSHSINKPTDSFDDVSPLLFYSDPVDDIKAPLVASPNSKDDKPFKEFYSNLQSQPVAKPTTVTNDVDVVTNPIVSKKDNSEKSLVAEIDVTKSYKINDKKQTINENVPDNADKHQKAESEPISTLPQDIVKQYSKEGSPLNADSPTDDESSTEDCTSGEIDPNNNGDDEEAADSENNIHAVLLSNIDLWEKLFAKHPNIELQAFNVVTSSPIVKKTSRLFAYPNDTTVEESIETVWEHEGDALPLEIKYAKIVKYPRRHAENSDKNEQDENKCD